VIEPVAQPDAHDLAGVKTGEEAKGIWTTRLVHFLRAMAVLSMLGGLR
jgi:hypothetical protein